MRTVFIITIFICLIYFSKIKTELKVLLFIFSIVIAFMMGLTRIYLGEHWLSDVLGGTLWGIATGFFASVLILSSKRGIKSIPA